MGASASELSRQTQASDWWCISTRHSTLVKDQVWDKSRLLSALRMRYLWTSGFGAQRKAQVGDGDWGGFKHHGGTEADQGMEVLRNSKWRARAEDRGRAEPRRAPACSGLNMGKRGCEVGTRERKQEVGRGSPRSPGKTVSKSESGHLWAMGRGGQGK